VLAALFAVGNWYAILRQTRRGKRQRRAAVGGDRSGATLGADRVIEYVCKPAVMVALIGAALTIDPVNDAMRAWFVVALVFSLAGDVFLMLPEDRSELFFVAGLGSFLIAHIAYVGGFIARGADWSAHWPALVIAPFVIWFLG